MKMIFFVDIFEKGNILMLVCMRTEYSTYKFSGKLKGGTKKSAVLRGLKVIV